MACTCLQFSPPLTHPLAPFFFSSRRRHTRSLCDWSSDVCSSDLGRGRRQGAGAHGAGYGPNGRVCALTTSHAHHRMTTVREGASLEASTACPAAGAAGAAGAIVAALARAGTDRKSVV